MPVEIEDAFPMMPEYIEACSPTGAQESEYHIYVLLTRYTDTLSKAVSGLSRGYYSHVSIGFDPSFDTFFSFTMKGFRIEVPSKICKKKKKEVPCVLYSLPVPESVYQYMYAHVEDYRANTSQWKFNLMGLACGMVRLPFYRRKNHRFCSQFVAEVLESSEAVRFKRNTATMLPKDFLKLPELNLEFKGTLSGLAASKLALQVS